MKKFKLTKEMIAKYQIKISKCKELPMCEKQTSCEECITKNATFWADKFSSVEPDNIRIKSCEDFVQSIGGRCSDYQTCTDCKKEIRSKMQLSTAQLLKKIQKDKAEGKLTVELEEDGE